MPEFRFHHPWLYRLGALSALWGMALAVAVAFERAYLDFNGLSHTSISYYDLRPFPIGGGLAGQLRFWRLLALPRLPVYGLALVAMGGIVGGWVRWPRPLASIGRWPRIWLTLAVGCGLAATALWAASSRYLGIRMTVHPMASLQGVERMAGVHFPPGTALVEAKGCNGWYGFMRAKVQMPKASVRGFLEAPPFAGKPSSRERPDFDRSYPYSSPTGWHPQTAARFLAAWNGEWTGGEIVEVLALADLDDPNTAFVYLQWVRQ
jgi:hypothetical protein